MSDSDAEGPDDDAADVDAVADANADADAASDTDDADEGPASLAGDVAAEAEPEEYDPEADLPDPERDLVSIPEAPSVTPESEVAPELRRAFWELVLVFNVALLALSVGVMLAAFERLWTVGGALVAIGTLSFLRGYYRYRQVTGEAGAELWAEGSDGAADEGERAVPETSEAEAGPSEPAAEPAEPGADSGTVTDR